MLLSREDLIATLFQETDRAQRMNTTLAVILIGVDGWESWQERLQPQALEEVESELYARIVRVLRCYDAAGRCGDGKFCLVLPGCNSFNAVGMAERLSSAVFDSVIRTGDEDLHLTACFGVAGSGGRSPLVVLRNAENALEKARARGPGSMERCSYDPEPDTASLLIPILEGKGYLL